MSYQVLARKWRPRRFAELVGQEHVVRALSNALDTGRTHHAYLFTGTRGVGKTTIARIFAKSLNCERGQSAEPCGECAVCEAVDAGRFVDLLEIDAASNTGVDDVRELIENAQYAPARGSYKVYLIDEVHMLSRNAFNALLKTLEEPPPHVKFLLATTDPQKLPATVLSRCLKFNLKRLLPDQISGQIRHILQAEGVEHDDEAVAELARAADGSLRDGLSLLDQAIAYGAGGLHAEEVRAMLGTVERSQLLGLMDALAAADGPGLIAECERMVAFSPDFAGVLNELAMLLHRIQMHQLIPDYRDDQPDIDAVARLARTLSPEDVQLFYQMAVVGHRDLGLAPDARTGFEMTVLRMLAFRPANASDTPRGSDSGKPEAQSGTAAPASPRQAPASPPRTVSPAASTAPPASTPAPASRPRVAPAPAAASAPAPTPAPTSANRGQVPEWEALIDDAGLRGPLRELAVNATLQSMEGQQMILALPASQFHLAVEPMTGQMQDKLAAALGHPVKLHFVHADSAAESPAARMQAARDARQAEAERAIDDDPLVQSMKRDFGAHVVPQSVKPLSSPHSEPRS